MSGSKAIQEIMTKFGYANSSSLNKQLWEKCRQHLSSRGLEDAIAHIESSESGNLDTLERGDLYDAIGLTLVGKHWPCNGDSEKASTAFLEALVKAFSEMGFRPDDLIEEGPSAGR
jgi:hypothetical protein